MSGTIRITLRAGERVYVNGAVIRVDRKTSLEFLNNVVFLLEQHVMQEEEATTPLRQLYFTVQKMLIEPASGFSARQDFYAHYLQLLDQYREDEAMIIRLNRIRALVNVGRNFEALKRIRSLCEAEDAAREHGGTLQQALAKEEAAGKATKAAAETAATTEEDGAAREGAGRGGRRVRTRRRSADGGVALRVAHGAEGGDS